jgi:hypothetical protein
MPTYRVVAGVNIAPDHYDGSTPGDPLALVTAHADARGPILFAISADNTQAVLEDMWVLGNRGRDDAQGRCWPTDVRSLSTGDTLVVYPPGYPQVPEPANVFAVASTRFVAIAAPRPGTWVRLEGPSATSRPVPATPAGPATALESASTNPEPL